VAHERQQDQVRMMSIVRLLQQMSKADVLSEVELEAASC
jgi:hypothetical protein